MKIKLLTASLLVATLFSCNNTKNVEKIDITGKIEPLNAPFPITVTAPQFLATKYSIVDFGAKTDSAFDNSIAIEKAISECNENGGGTVIVPAGVWFTKGIHLKSNVNLHLSEGAELLFSDVHTDYLPVVFTRWEGIECMNYSPLIYTVDCENVAITGKGKLNGNGKSWWTYKNKKQKMSLTKLYDMVNAGVEPKNRIMCADSTTSYLRPSFVQFINCKNVLVEDYTITSGPMWTNHFVYCENVIARGLQIVTHGVNNDGLVPDACKNMLIENCFFSTGDDCVVIKSGLNEDGWRVNKPCENLVIRNCNTEEGHGGVVIGSEMSGGIQNIYAHDCNFSGTERGLRIKSMRGRGAFVKNIWFNDITMANLHNEVIVINMDYGSSSIEPRTQVPPVFDNINIKNIKSTGSEYGIRLFGLEESKISNITISNVEIETKCGLELVNTKDVKFDNIKIVTDSVEIVKFEGNDNLTITNSTLNNVELNQKLK